MYYRMLSIAVICFPYITWAQKETGGNAPASPMANLGGMLPMMLIMFAAVYFLMIRPEQKKQKERQSMLQAIKKGDRVITSSGMLGVVGSIKENTMMVKIAENTVVEFTKSAVTNVINKDGTEKQVESQSSGKKQ